MSLPEILPMIAGGASLTLTAIRLRAKVHLGVQRRLLEAPTDDDLERPWNTLGTDHRRDIKRVVTMYEDGKLTAWEMDVGIGFLVGLDADRILITQELMDKVLPGWGRSGGPTYASAAVMGVSDANAAYFKVAADSYANAWEVSQKKEKAQRLCNQPIQYDKWTRYECRREEGHSGACSYIGRLT